MNPENNWMLKHSKEELIEHIESLGEMYDYTIELKNKEITKLKEEYKKDIDFHNKISNVKELCKDICIEFNDNRFRRIHNYEIKLENIYKFIDMINKRLGKVLKLSSFTTLDEKITYLETNKEKFKYM